MKICGSGLPTIVAVAPGGVLERRDDRAGPGPAARPRRRKRRGRGPRRSSRRRASTAWVASRSSSKSKLVVAGDHDDVGLGGPRGAVDDPLARRRPRGGRSPASRSRTRRCRGRARRARAGSRRRRSRPPRARPARPATTACARTPRASGGRRWSRTRAACRRRGAPRSPRGAARVASLADPDAAVEVEQHVVVWHQRSGVQGHRTSVARTGACSARVNRRHRHSGPS